MQDDDELVALTSYRFAPKAELAKSCLEAAGIRAFIDNLAVVMADWFLGNAVGYIKLSVPRSQVEQAVAILQEHPELLDAAQEKTAQEQKDEAAGVTRCLSCDAPMSDDSDVCAACGWSYDDTKGEDAQDEDARTDEA